MYRKIRRNCIAFLALLSLLPLVLIISHSNEVWPFQRSRSPAVNNSGDRIISFSNVLVIGTDFIPLRSAGLATLRSYKYVLLLPHAIQRISPLSSILDHKLSSQDRNSLNSMINFLESSGKHNGVSCRESTKSSERHHLYSYAYSRVPPCYFYKKNMSLFIGDNEKGKSKQILRHQVFYKDCNIVDGAFILRREILFDIGLNNSYGETTLLDLFIRGKGRLQIASLSHCSLSEELHRLDRGRLNGNATFLDYVTLGAAHNILRIVRDNGITWTKCLADRKLCPEKTLGPVTNSLLPVCCSRVLDKLLEDTVKGLVNVGLDYRVQYGTLLGGVRSRAIIPWTGDVDIGLHEYDYFDNTLFDKLEKFLRARKYSIPTIMGQRRVIPLFPPHMPMQISPLHASFQQRLFNPRIVRAMKRLLPLTASWKQLCYGDFYIAKEDYFGSLATVTINGKGYSAFSAMHDALVEWYGPKFMEPNVRQSARMEISITKARKKRERKMRAMKRKRRKGKKSRRKKKNKRRTRSGAEMTKINKISQ